MEIVTKDFQNWYFCASSLESLIATFCAPKISLENDVEVNFHQPFFFFFKNFIFVAAIRIFSSKILKYPLVCLS